MGRTRNSQRRSHTFEGLFDKLGSTPKALCGMLEGPEGLKPEMLRVSLGWDCSLIVERQ